MYAIRSYYGISPEAPVPVVAVEKESHTLGGAGNVINNLSAMGAKVFAMGTVGTGQAGRDVLKKLEALSVDVTGVICDPDRPTTRKTRIIAASQQMLRIDREVRHRINAHTRITSYNVCYTKLLRKDRVFTGDATRVSQLGTAVIQGLQKGGVMAVAKHFV